MFLHDACDQPIFLAWVGNICSHVALEKWGWPHCSPVSPPSSGQCYCWKSRFPSPAPHSQQAVWWLYSPPLTVMAFILAICSSTGAVRRSVGQRKEIRLHRSLCQSSVALFFLLMAPWLDPFAPPTNPKAAMEISSRPAEARAIFCWRVPFFVLSVTDVLFLRRTLPYTLIFQQMKEKSYPVEYYFLPLSLLAVTHFLPSL